MHSDPQGVAELELDTMDASNSPLDKPGLVACLHWPLALCPQQSCCAGHCPVPRGLGWAGLGPLGSTHIQSPVAHVAVWSSGQSFGSGVGWIGLPPLTSCDSLAKLCYLSVPCFPHRKMRIIRPQRLAVSSKGVNTWKALRTVPGT